MKTIRLIQAVLVATSLGGLVACNSGSNSGNGNQTATQTSANVVPLSSQLLTVSSIGIVTQQNQKIRVANFKAQSSNNCFQLVEQNGSTYTLNKKSSQWWSTATLTFSVKNTCPTEKAANNQQVLITGFKMNGNNITNVGDVSQSGNPWVTTSTSVSGANVGLFFSTSPCEGTWCSWAKIPANGVKTFTINVANNGPIDSISVDSVTIPGSTPEPTPGPTVEPTPGPTVEPTPGPTVEPTPPTPALTGDLDITVDTTSIVDVCKSTTCNIKLNVVSPAGQQLDTTTINPSTDPNKLVEFKNLLPGNYTFSIDQSSLPAGASTSYLPSNGIVSVEQGQLSKAGALVNYSAPEQLGDIKVTLANVNNESVFAGLGLINGTITDKDTNQKYPFTISLGGSYDLKNVPAGHTYKVTVQGIANAKAGVYYSPVSSNDVEVNNAGTARVELSYSAQPSTHEVTFEITGEPIHTNPLIRFADAANDYRFVETNTVSNAAEFKFPTNTAVAVTLSSVPGFDVTTDPTPLVITVGLDMVTLDYTKQTEQTMYFDYMSPFKDYNHKMTLTISGVNQSASSVTFTSNFAAKAGWGTCFGAQVFNLNFNTNKVGDKYVTTISPKSASDVLDLTKSCDVFGTDTGNGQPLPGVDDAIVYTMETVLSNKQSINLDMYKPCTANGCKDPGNGYVNAGYYAQWSVWGRKYNPYNMPFSDINDVIYAFIGFDKNNGNIFSLDKDADSWGMSATSRALRQYPYLKAHLSFGGWTNNGVNTAPMFEQLASSQASMDNFTNQAIKLMRATGFTGIDIDWEWWSDYGNNVAPAKKMLQFYKTLRAGIDKASLEDGKKYTLTIAVNGGRDRIVAMENPSNPNSVSDFWAQVNGLVDYVNVMNYDYHGSWDVNNPAYFQANYQFANVPSQYSAAVGEVSGWSIKDGMDAYIAAGVQPRKLVMGIPLYARTMAVNSGANGGLFQTVTGPGYGDYEAGVLDYKCLINPVNDPATGCGSAKPIAGVQSTSFYNSTAIGDRLSLFNQYGRDALQPWGYSAQTNSFVTYDDKWSAVSKASKVIESDLGGTMYWELDGDAQDPNQSIVHAVKERYNY